MPALPTWPAGVPGNGIVRRAGYKYLPAANMMQSEQQVGRKRRKRSTLAWAERSCTVRMTAAHFDMFEDWVRDDLAGGNKRFAWIPPYRASTVPSEFKEQDGRPFSAEPAPGGGWIVSFIIESLEP